MAQVKSKAEGQILEQGEAERNVVGAWHPTSVKQRMNVSS